MAHTDPLAQRRARLSDTQRERLAERLRGGAARAPAAPTIPRLGRTTAPMSHAQQRLWFLWQLDPSDTTYHLGAALRLEGHLDGEAVQAALDAVVARHEALRTDFQPDADGRAVQHIRPVRRVPLVTEDLSNEDGEARAMTLARAFHDQPFDLANGPLLRACHLRTGEGKHLLVLVMHHIATDAWSRQIVLGEFAAHYNARVRGEPCVLRELPIQYADHAQWQRDGLASGESARQLAWWTTQLGPAQPVLQLPADRPRGASSTRRAAELRVDVPAATATALLRFAQARHTTPFVALLTAFFLVLHRHTGERDLRVGVPTANRHQADTAGVVGLFVNTQVMRCLLDETDTPGDVLDRVREATLGAQAHQDLPFDQLVEALAPGRGDHGPQLFQVMFNHLKLDHEALTRLEGLMLHDYVGLGESAPFDLVLDTLERGDGRLAANFRFDAALFDRTTIERFARHYLAALDGLVALAGSPLRAMDLLSPTERERLSAWGDRTGTFESTPIHVLIERQVRERPDATAVVFEDQSLSYAELNRRANQVAHRLIGLGVGPEVKVGLSTQRSLEMVVGLLGILKAGGAYVPLDPAYPADRLAYMQADSGVALVLGSEDLGAERFA
ncbi:condensation domain-containing protein, partial [Piscinibacter gummiphilus]